MLTNLGVVINAMKCKCNRWLVGLVYYPVTKVINRNVKAVIILLIISTTVTNEITASAVDVRKRGVSRYELNGC